MKIKDLSIRNFRGIRALEATDLGDTVIIAGQNGSGKSCIFDAIRLLKSTYGGYQQNEWQNFFGEFAIQLHGPTKNLGGLFNDRQKEVDISATFTLGDEERAFVTRNAQELLQDTIWQSLVPEAFQYGGYRNALFSSQFRDRQPEVNARVAAELPMLHSELAQPHVSARIIIKPDGSVMIFDSKLITVLFSNYRPREIGVIDFHGAQRHYGRENIQGVNLSLNQGAGQSHSAHALYNYSAKYANVKSEMAANYISELLAQEAEGSEANGAPISKVLEELFEVFFPDKKFSGAKPTAAGGLEFPVTTQNGSVHDLDELSSGEKEILYGYLRIRSSAPRNSIILLDEPELHLNPRLIRGLPDFYRKNLSEALKNQLWLITHSDALIREAVGKPGFNVFHMLPSGAEGSETSQLKELSFSEDLDAVLADLVGDLAAYRPGGKGLLFEGGGDSDFDKNMVSGLFPDELRGFNLISGSNKTKVNALHEILERAWSRGDLPTKFFAITDRDSDQTQQTAAVTRFSWNVYHIENYLLHDKFIAESLNSALMSTEWSDQKVAQALEAAARNVVSSVLEHKMRSHANDLIVKCIKVGFKPKTLTLAKDLAEAARRSHERISALLAGDLGEDALRQAEQESRLEIEQSFATGTWREILPGRDILKGLAGEVGLSYEILRNIVLSRMIESGFKPDGMKEVIDKIKGC